MPGDPDSEKIISFQEGIGHALSLTFCQQDVNMKVLFSYPPEIPGTLFCRSPESHSMELRLFMIAASRRLR
jgi:hypothetical protein